MSKDIEELLKEIHALDPRMIATLEEIAQKSIKEDKLKLYGMLFGNNKAVDYKVLIDTLSQHPLRRLDFSFTANDKRFKVAISYNELPKLEEEAVVDTEGKENENNSAGSN